MRGGFVTGFNSLSRSCHVSKTPAFIKLSNDFLLRIFKGMRDIKSAIDLKGPFAFLSLIISSTTFSPTFLIALSPKRILPPGQKPADGNLRIWGITEK